MAENVGLLPFALHFSLYAHLKMRQMRHYKKGCLNRLFALIF